MAAEPNWWYRHMQDTFDWECGFTPQQHGTWTSAKAIYPGPTRDYVVVDNRKWEAEDIQKLLGAKNGQVVALKEPEKLIYMGLKAYSLYRDFAREHSDIIQPGRQSCFLGIPIVPTTHLRPLMVLSADLHIQNEVGEIIKEQIDANLKKEERRLEQEQIARIYYYRLEEPQHLWRMALIGTVIGGLLMAAYWLILRG